MVRLALLLLLTVVSPLRAEMLTDDLDDVKIGMTPNQVIAILKTVDPADPVVATAPCTSADRYARTCITTISAGPPTNQTSIFFVEDLPTSPGTMRVYAATSVTLTQPWTDRDQAAWEAIVSRDLGRPDCVQLAPDGRLRAWSRRGVVSCAALPLPETRADSPVTDRVIWEFQASNGRLHQLVLIDLGFYRART